MTILEKIFFKRYLMNDVLTHVGYYEELGIGITATSFEIKKAYYELAKRYHPDKNIGDKGAEEKFKRISKIYSILIDEEKRRDYDEHGSVDGDGDDEDGDDGMEEGDCTLEEGLWTFEQLKEVFGTKLEDDDLRAMQANLEYESMMEKSGDYNLEVVRNEVEKALSLGVTELKWTKKQNLIVDSVLFDLTKLTSLCLSNCNIRCMDESISKLVNLTRIDFSVNKLKAFDVLCLSTLSDLDLQHNQIESFPEDSKFLQLKNLQNLNLFHNNIKKVSKSVILLEKLKKLDLECNNIQRFDYGPEDFRNAHSMVLLLDPTVKSFSVNKRDSVAKKSTIKKNSFKDLDTVSNTKKSTIKKKNSSKGDLDTVSNIKKNTIKKNSPKEDLDTVSNTKKRFITKKFSDEEGHGIGDGGDGREGVLDGTDGVGRKKKKAF